jgi:methyl-accepting chemotaxis protein
MTLIVSAAIVAVIVTLLFRRMVIRRLAVMESSFQAIAHGNGDLKSRVRVSGNDEIDRLGIHFNSVLEKLHASLVQVAAESEQITTSSKHLADASSVAADRVSDQESATEQVAEAVTKVSSAISAVADSAAKAASIAESVASEGKIGSATLASTIGAIDKLASDAQSVTQSLARLGANTDQIGGVVGVIRGIAEQTNLLALNAAIEAARAGENGRGFAVVADEVRTLSQRTQQSTQEIHQMIAKLQEGVKGVVQLISSNDVATKQVASQAGEAGRAISSIMQAISTLASVSAEIAASTSEQRRVIGDIDRSIVAISQATTETAASVAASNDAGHSLQKVAEQLSTITRSFNL